MSARSQRSTDGRPKPKTGRRRLVWLFSILAAAGVAAAAALLLLRETPGDADRRAFEKLVGRWIRLDGGYVIEIRSVDARGAMDAAYLNPRPIRVAQALASREGGSTKVFLELRDEGYPGSTYTLTYDPPADSLRGMYFQAAMGQRFDVRFVRVK